MTTHIQLPTQTFTNARGGAIRLYSPEDAQFIEQLRLSTYFLVKNGGADDPAPCRRCGRKHTYLTRGCVEQPFRGLRGALYRFAKVTNNDELRVYLDSRQIPDLATRHPFTAHALKPDEHGEDVLAFELGAAIPISEERALKYVEMLKMRRVKPPYILES